MIYFLNLYFMYFFHSDVLQENKREIDKEELRVSIFMQNWFSRFYHLYKNVLVPHIVQCTSLNTLLLKTPKTQWEEKDLEKTREKEKEKIEREIISKEMIVPIFDGDRCLYLSFKVWLSHLPVSLPDSNLISSQMVSDDKLGNKTFYGLRKKFNNYFLVTD